MISWHLQDDPHPRLVRILRLGDSREWDAYGSMCGPMKENTCSHWQSYWSSLLCVRISADGADISAARDVIFMIIVISSERPRSSYKIHFDDRQLCCCGTRSV